MKTRVAGESSAPMKESKGKKELDHIRVYRAENGGHTIEHHFKNLMQEPERHAFGPEQGDEAMDHIQECCGMKC